MSDLKPYRLSQRSPIGNPGFESFKAKDNGLYYFHFNNDKGEAILFSQGYKTAKERTTSRNALRSRIPEKSSYSKKTEKGMYYFLLSKGDKEVLGRSKNFKTKELRDQLIQELQQIKLLGDSFAKKDLSPSEASPKNPKSETKSQGSSASAAVQPARYRFNVTFRKVADEAPLLGEIQFPISKGKTTFQGFDIEAIEAFMVQHLPADKLVNLKGRQKKKESSELDQEDSAKQQVELQKEFSKRTSKLEQDLAEARERIKSLEEEIETISQEKEPPPGPSSNGDALLIPSQVSSELAEQFQEILAKEEAKVKKPLALRVGGHLEEKLNLARRNVPIELLLPIEPGTEQKAFDSYRAIFQIKSMESGQIMSEVSFSGRLNPQSQILVSSNRLNTFQPGLYRMIIRVFPLNSSTPEDEIVGKRVVYLH